MKRTGGNPGRKRETFSGKSRPTSPVKGRLLASRLENFDLHDLEALLRQQESLRAVIESISQELALRPLLTNVVRHACELIGADNGTIGLVDPVRNVVRTEAVYRMPPNELGSEIGYGIGLAGRVLLTQQPVLLERYGDLENPTQTGMLENTVIGVPISWHGQMSGFFGIGARPPRKFEQHDVDMLSQFARHAAIAIENARRYEWEQRRTERFSLIARIGSMVTAQLRLEELLQNAADAIHERLGYPNVAIPLIDPDNPEVLILRYFGGHYKTIMGDEYRLPIQQGIMGEAARGGMPVLVNDVTSDPRYYSTPGAEGIIAELAVPILLDKRVLGVLNVESATPLTPDDAAILQVVADQLAIAIENARLFSGKQRALEEMQLLYQTSHRIGMAMSIDEVIYAYLEQVAARGRCTCTILTYERKEANTDHTVLIRGRWIPGAGIESLEQPLPCHPEDLYFANAGGSAIPITNTATDPRLSPGFREVAGILRWPPSLTLIPLQVRGQRIGLVILSYPRTYSGLEEDSQRYQATAAQLATAIDHHRQQILVHDRGQQVAVLEERQRLARELHDSVTQLVFSVTLIAQTLGPAWRRDPAEGEKRAQRLLDLSRSALAEMRDLLQELRPPTGGAMTGTESNVPTIGRVRREGLVAALEAQATDAARDGRIVVVDAGGYQQLPLEQEEALFRITQEALNNAAKHARAHCVDIHLWAEDRETHLTVTDDGVGFLPGNDASPGIVPRTRSGGMGLTTMQERAEAFGGSVHIASKPGRGTRIEVTLPKSNPGK